MAAQQTAAPVDQELIVPLEVKVCQSGTVFTWVGVADLPGVSLHFIGVFTVAERGQTFSVNLCHRTSKYWSVYTLYIRLVLVGVAPPLTI